MSDTSTSAVAKAITLSTLEDAHRIYRAWEAEMGFDEYGGAPDCSVSTLVISLLNLNQLEHTSQVDEQIAQEGLYVAQIQEAFAKAAPE